MTNTNPIKSVVNAVQRVRTVDDAIAPYKKIVTDLEAVIAQREELINAAAVRKATLLNQIAALDDAVKMHQTEISSALDLKSKFGDLLG